MYVMILLSSHTSAFILLCSPTLHVHLALSFHVPSLTLDHVTFISLPLNSLPSLGGLSCLLLIG